MDLAPVPVVDIAWIWKCQYRYWLWYRLIMETGRSAVEASTGIRFGSGTAHVPSTAYAPRYTLSEQ